MARVPLRSQSDLPEKHQYLLSEDALGERSVVCAIANEPAVFQSYMRYGSTLWEAGELTVRQRELAILGVARALDSRYEWQQHVELGRVVGIEDAALRAIGRGDLNRFEDANRALLRYARAFAERDVTDAVHAALAEQFDTGRRLRSRCLRATTSPRRTPSTRWMSHWRNRSSAGG
jgi:4-carboxymuconolactone decarboxylase